MTDNYYAQELLAERCAATHDAILGGRAAVEPVAITTDKELGWRRPTFTYVCPHCGKTLHRTLTPSKL